ncbi:hypothetical protein [Streptomyces sp. NPDC001348]
MIALSGPRSPPHQRLQQQGPPEEIAATRILQTFVEGRRVHAAAEA